MRKEGFESDMKVLKDSKLSKPLLAAVLVVVLILFALLFPQKEYLLLNLCTICVYIVAVSGLDILVGFTGQVSFGHAGFFAIGAYGSALLSMKLGIPVFVSMLLGACLSTLIAIPIGYFSSRLRVVFLTLSTTTFGTLVYLCISKLPFAGGFTGIFPPALTIFGQSLSERNRYFIFSLICAIIFLFIKQNIYTSRTGRAMCAVRENIAAASGMGVNTRKYKVYAFTISAFYTGFAGAMYAHLIQYLSPDTFVFSQSITFVTVLVLGGRACLMGPILGAILLTGINTALLPLGQYKSLVYGVILLLTLFFVPKGVVETVGSLIRKLTRGKNHADS